MTSRGIGVVVGLALLVAGTTAQDDFVNFEIQPARALDIARVDGRDYLLVCNTPDDSLEIYSIADGHAFVDRVPVGLAPVTVVWNAYLGRAYTCNFLGDSISMVRIKPSPADPGRIEARIVRTSLVGDEPTDLEFLPGELSLFVTLRSRSAFGWHDSLDLAPIGGLFGLKIPATFPLFAPNAEKALKNPLRVLLHGTKMLIMGQLGGHTPRFDFDLYGLDFANGVQTELGGLGSANADLVSALDGKVYVVGGLAQNHLQGAAALSLAPTGFVQSRLWVVSDAGTPAASIESRDLNRDRHGDVVSERKAIAQPTGVAVLDEPGRVRKVFVTGFGSDRVGVLRTNDGAPSSWHMHYIRLGPIPSRGYDRVGPRALALKRAAPGIDGDPGLRLYCLNSLDHSVSIIDPDREREVGRIALQRDPTPQVVRAGREFLYGAHLSGNGFVSCSSCHIDGRTDFTAWNLGVPGGGEGEAIPEDLIDGVVGPGPREQFPLDKGAMLTQTLQGLVNHPVGGDAQDLFTNAPYHWRGDRRSIRDFNEAFVSLLGGENVGSPADPKGISDTDMDRFEAYLQTIMYPPNPEQRITRRFRGEFGDPDLEDGSGAQRGSKLFHTHPLGPGAIAGRSCVGCHALPEGSNNRITLVDNLGGTGLLPFETAATRMLFEREGRLEDGPLTLSETQTSEFGLLHPGIPRLSINRFMFNTFRFAFAGEFEKLNDVTAFVREFDSGVAPIIGRSLTVKPSDNTNTGVTRNSLDLLEPQVRVANAGLAVQARLAGRRTGFWFDVSTRPAVYREIGSGIAHDREGLLSLVREPREHLIFQATPVGSELRVADPTGVGRALSGPPPSDVTLATLVPGTAWANIPRLTKNWRKGTGPDDFNWLGPPEDEPRSLKAIRIFQAALAAKAPSFGVTIQRHEAPRRFRVLGRNLRLGAELHLSIPADPDLAPPYAPGQGTVQTMSAGLFPTDRFAGDGRQYWETTVEADPQLVHVLLLGGPFAPDVAAALRGEVEEPPPPSAFDPIAWNWYQVTVTNADGTTVDAGWQRLRIE